MASPDTRRRGAPSPPSTSDSFTHCPPLRFPPPWDFLQAPRHCRGPVADPTPCWPTSRPLDEATLRAAEVLSTSPEEVPHLSPGLPVPTPPSSPSAIRVMARCRGLLTARGCLPEHYLPIYAVAGTSWTRGCGAGHGRAVRDRRHPGGGPAASSRPAGDAEPRSAPTVAGRAGQAQQTTSWRTRHARCAARPTLALVGWSPLSLAAHSRPRR